MTKNNYQDVSTDFNRFFYHIAQHALWPPPLAGGAHNKSKQGQPEMHKVSTPSAEMAGSWWFQHVPTDSNCQGRSIPLHWNLLKKERLLPGWRRGKRVHVFEKQWETHDLDHLDHSHRRQIIPRSASGEHRWLSRWSHKVGVNAPHVDGTQMTYPEHDVCQWLSMYVFIVYPFFYWDMKELQMCD